MKVIEIYYYALNTEKVQCKYYRVIVYLLPEVMFGVGIGSWSGLGYH